LLSWRHISDKSIQELVHDWLMCWVLIELLLSRISGQLISIHHSTPRTMEQVHIITILGGYYKAFANQTQTVYLMTEKLIIIYKYIWFIWYMLFIYIYISTLYIYIIKNSISESSHQTFQKEDSFCGMTSPVVIFPYWSSFQWPFQEPIYWRYLSYIRLLQAQNFRTSPHIVWFPLWQYPSTSILGSWNCHWLFTSWKFQDPKMEVR
jgi:hypothetical protein